MHEILTFKIVFLMELFPLQKWRKHSFWLKQATDLATFANVPEMCGFWQNECGCFFQLKPIELGDTVSAWLNILLNHVMSQRKSIECKTQNLNRRTNAVHSHILLLSSCLSANPFCKRIAQFELVCKTKENKNRIQFMVLFWFWLRIFRKSGF